MVTNRRSRTRSRLPVARPAVRAVVIAVAAGLVMSSMEVVVGPELASADQPRSNAVSPRDVPLLPSAAAAPEPAAPPDPNADFAPLSTSDGADGSHFDAERSRLVSRSMFAEEYVNPDGTHTVKQATDPLNVKDSAGVWHPVDTGMTSDVAAGRVRVNRHPLSPTLAVRGNDASLVSVEVDGGRASLGLEQAAASSATVAGSKVGYADVLPNTDVDYEITAGSVKETIRLKRPPAPGQSSWRFRLRTAGLTPSVAQDGSVVLADSAGGNPIVMPPIETWDSSGTADRPPAVTGGRYELERVADGWVLVVSVDEGWLRDPGRVYPVSVDPTFSFAADNVKAYKSDGVVCENCGVKIGNPLDQGKVWRSVFHFNYASLWGKTVVGARLDVSNNRNASAVDKTFNADLYRLFGRCSG